MPLHDWTRLPDSVYHDFHTEWLIAVKHVLNGGVLPPGYYARSEQSLRTMGPDVLTLQARRPPVPEDPSPSGRLTAVAHPPRVSVAAATRPRVAGFRQKRITVRHSTGDRVIAIIELVSPGNKASGHPLRAFVRKIVRAADAGIHTLVIDPFPPGPRDPNGIHGAIWPVMGGEPFKLPPGRPLTVASYEAGVGVGASHRCYVEPMAVGDPFPDMPLFLEPDEYVNVPLERAYTNALAGMLPQDRALLESGT